MKRFNEHLYDDQKAEIELPVNLIWKIIVNWINNDSEPAIEKMTESLEVYRVSLNSSIDCPEKKSKTPSAILKRCEGARGILYMNEVNENPFHPYTVLKRTRIIEIKDVSMKIRIHEDEVVNQLIHIENVLGFLKEVD